MRRITENGTEEADTTLVTNITFGLLEETRTVSYLRTRVLSLGICRMAQTMRKKRTQDLPS